VLLITMAAMALLGPRPRGLAVRSVIVSLMLAVALYSGVIVLGRIAKRGQDEEVYYNHSEVSSNEKEVSVKFSMARSEMGQLLSKYSEEKK